MKRAVLLGVCVLLCLPLHGQQTKARAMTVDDLFRCKRLADPQVSPDGHWVVYAVGNVDLQANRVISNLWLAPTDPARGKPRQLTSAQKSDRHPRWSPDGKYILFESPRSGSSQIWYIAVDGGEARQLTSIATGANTAIWAPDGKAIAFVSGVWPEYSTKPFRDSDAFNKKRMDEQEKNPVKARVFTRLFFRHWDEYVENKRQHLFVLEIAPQANGLQPVGLPRDVTPGDRDAYPTSSTFSIGDDFTFAPDGKHLYFTAPPTKDEAWSTNYDIWRVSVAGGPSENLTKDNPAADSAPQFSPDGKWLAYRAQARPGFEADRWQLMIIPSPQHPDEDKEKSKKPIKPRSLTRAHDAWVDAFAWLPDSQTIYFASDVGAKTSYYAADLKMQDGSARPSYISQHTNYGLSLSKDGRVMSFLRAALHHPPEVFVGIKKNGDWAVRNLSQANDAILGELDRPRPESVNVPGAGGTPMQMWILKPPGFNDKMKWPLVYLVHGGPQGAWDDGWSWRWNPSLWAAQGYVVALPNPRGSTGFGQKYIDEISGDWGGKVYEDLMLGLAHLEKQPWIDSQRMAAAGASYGGYMMNWFAVNTGKFKTLINHCGVWNFDSMYASTEELWFDEWEHGGPPWGKNRESYEKHSPHMFAANLMKYKTPTLIIHNDLDFRVPVSEGIQLFTTLQRMGIESKFINFPDEGHWVLKPRNSQYWHQEVFAWLKNHVAAGGK